jgi:hypothetical protein
VRAPALSVPAAGKGLSLAAVALLAAAGASSCGTRSPGRLATHVEARAAGVGEAPSPARDPLAELREWENATRARTDFAHTATSETALGADPYAVWRMAHSSDRVGILRGQSVLVELDASMHEVARLPAPESPTGLAVGQDGEVLVVGELSSEVARYRGVRGRLEAAGTIELPGVRAMRDVAVGPEGVIYVVEEHDGRLLTLRPAPGEAPAPPLERTDTPLCHGPVHVLRAASAVIVDCLLDHAIVLRPVDARGFPRGDGEVRIVHDGPMWGMDALPDGDGLLVAIGGVEDHPLDRTEGSFGFIDSFLTLYRVAHGRAVELSAINVSELGVVTPKALRLARSKAGELELIAAGYGSDRLALVRWPATRTEDGLGVPFVETRALPPGCAAVERSAGVADVEPSTRASLALANPLLDAWVVASPEGNSVVRVDDAGRGARSADSRLGEALLFTTLIAPWDRSEGRLSRFTCETCHFEGYVDGRTHFTGRGDVYATTKPLLGLFNNRPHFSRALDPDMTTMVNNEFRVAGARSDHDPWFSLSVDAFPWVDSLGIARDSFAPEDLRRALMAFLMDFMPRPNPAVAGRSRWSDVERAGAEVFRDRCESCHEARLVTDEPSTRAPFERWEALVMAPEGALVWASAEYQKTGVLPYVNERGARVVSLRRLYKKYPYFTNGSAKDLASVLDRASFAGGRFFHDAAPAGAIGLRGDEKRALAAFLDLL